MITDAGTKANGVPEGIKKAKNRILCINNPNIVTPIIIVKDKLKVTTIDVVNVYEYGILPVKLAINIKKNKE